MRSPQQEPPARTREAAFTSAAVVLIGAGLFFPNGWPLILGGLILLVLAVSARA